MNRDRFTYGLLAAIGLLTLVALLISYFAVLHAAREANISLPVIFPFLFEAVSALSMAVRLYHRWEQIDDVWAKRWSYVGLVAPIILVVVLNVWGARATIATAYSVSNFAMAIIGAVLTGLMHGLPPLILIVLEQLAGPVIDHRYIKQEQSRLDRLRGTYEQELQKVGGQLKMLQQRYAEKVAANESLEARLGMAQIYENTFVRDLAAALDGQLTLDEFLTTYPDFSKNRFKRLQNQFVSTNGG